MHIDHHHWFHGVPPEAGPDVIAALRSATTQILAAITAATTTTTQELYAMSESNQAHADALTAQLVALDDTLKTGVAAIVAEIATLKAGNPAVDFAPLDTAVANLGTDVAAVTAASA